MLSYHQSQNLKLLRNELNHVPGLHNRLQVNTHSPAGPASRGQKESISHAEQYISKYQDQQNSNRIHGRQLGPNTWLSYKSTPKTLAVRKRPNDGN